MNLNDMQRFRDKKQFYFYVFTGLESTFEPMSSTENPGPDDTNDVVPIIVGAVEGAIIISVVIW